MFDSGMFGKMYPAAPKKKPKLTILIIDYAYYEDGCARVELGNERSVTKHNIPVDILKALLGVDVLEDGKRYDIVIYDTTINDAEERISDHRERIKARGYKD